MTQLTTMDKAAANALGEATREALEAVAERFGVTAKLGGGKYDPFGGTYAPKIEYAIPAIADKAAEQDAQLYGLPEGSIGKTFTAKGRTFKVTGINPRARSMPVEAVEVATGKSYKFKVEGVKRALAAQEVPA